jgi:hypothetical protein
MMVYDMGMDQYLLIPFLVGWTSIYKLFWCSPGVQGFDPSPHCFTHITDPSRSCRYSLVPGVPPPQLALDFFFSLIAQANRPSALVVVEGASLSAKKNQWTNPNDGIMMEF